MAEKDSQNKKSRTNETPALEWFAAITGLILVAGTIGFLIYSAVTENGSPPKLTVRADSVTAVENGYLVKFSLSNDGENNAADVIVEGKITDGGKDLETSSVTVAYAPSHSKREGGLFFSNQPKQGENFQLRALGYNRP